MLTPVELQNLPLKAGMGGYKKKDVDELLEEITKDYEFLYKENLELKDKLSVLSEGLQYYKEMEKTLQKTLVVAEKTAEEMQTSSQAKADLIIEKAKAEAAYIIEDAKKQAQQIYNQTMVLVQQYENYRIQYKQLAAAQVKLMDSEAYQIHFDSQTPEFILEQSEEPTVPVTLKEPTKVETIAKTVETVKPVTPINISKEEVVEKISAESLAVTKKLEGLPLQSLKSKTAGTKEGSFEFFEN